MASEVPICSDLQGVTYSGTPGRPLFIQRHTTPIRQSSHWGDLWQGRCCSRLEWCHHLVQPVTATRAAMHVAAAISHRQGADSSVHLSAQA